MQTSPPHFSTTQPWRFLLQTYLRNALCPAPLSAGLPLRDRPKDSPWHFTRPEEMSIDDSQALVTVTSPKVIELDIWDFRTMIRKYIDDAPDIFITEDDKAFMDIPCYDVNTVAEGQLDFLSRVNNQDEFIILIMKFVLGPVTECCRLFNNIPRNAPMAQSLQFIAMRGPNDPPEVDYDVLRIPASMYGGGPLSIICIPPWKLDAEDLRAFAFPSQIPRGNNHPRFKQPSAEATVNARDLWQVALQVCSSEPSGSCFVVTNYLFWCFGRFESAGGGKANGKGKGKASDSDQSWTSAIVSPPIELEMSVPNGIRLPKMTEPMGLGCTVPECLLFWIQMTRGAAPSFEA